MKVFPNRAVTIAYIVLMTAAAVAAVLAYRARRRRYRDGEPLSKKERAVLAGIRKATAAARVDCVEETDR